MGEQQSVEYTKPAMEIAMEAEGERRGFQRPAGGGGGGEGSPAFCQSRVRPVLKDDGGLQMDEREPGVGGPAAVRTETQSGAGDTGSWANKIYDTEAILKAI
ncbi:unnamed protein product [Gadus morhua 'NCC']